MRRCFLLRKRYQVFQPLTNSRISLKLQQQQQQQLLQRPQQPQRHNYHEISYRDHGDPSNVLQYKRFDFDPDVEFENIFNEYNKNNAYHPPNDALVRVSFQYSPVNPADLNAIEGRYPSPFSSSKKHSTMTKDIPNIDKSIYFPSSTIPASEVIGIVTHVSSFSTHNQNHQDDCDDCKFQVGDLVMPIYPGMGTWRSSVVLPSSYFYTIKSLTHSLPSSSNITSQIKDKNRRLLNLSTISTNPCTAYRLLHDFLPSSFIKNTSLGATATSNVTDTDNDASITILQNGGASSVGIAVSQLASSMGIKCISMVRRGSRSESQYQDLVSHLYQIGKNALVLEEERLIDGGTQEIQDALHQIRQISGGAENRPILGLNCIGGESVNVMMKLLRKNSTIVTYGGMSKRPLTIPTGRLIFDQIRFCSYWHSLWLVEHGTSQERWQMMDHVLHLLDTGKLVLGEKRVFRLKDLQDAFEWHNENFYNHQGPMSSKKSFLKPKIVFQCDE